MKMICTETNAWTDERESNMRLRVVDIRENLHNLHSSTNILWAMELRMEECSTHKGYVKFIDNFSQKSSRQEAT
jgi:hypothetical protein